MHSSPDVYGHALVDYYRTQKSAPLWVHSSYGTREEMPVDWFFRQPNEFPELEAYALSLCRGRVLDIGAGVGSHALALQKRALEVIAIEQSSLAAEIMADRGVKQVEAINYQNYAGPKVDTILIMMNGIGLVGNLAGLSDFLTWAKLHLKPDGQLLFDSSDISYLFNEDGFPPDCYYGEVQFQYEYQEEYGEWFPWLYIDFTTLLKASRQSGWQVQRIYEDETQQYLARLTPTH